MELQHRGGPKGFIRVLDDHTLGWTDFRGNRQYALETHGAEIAHLIRELLGRVIPAKPWKR